MKINENNEMMERYWKSLLKEVYSERDDYIGFEDDAFDGTSIGQEGKFYHITFRGIASIIDDSDFSPRGYGRHVHPEYKSTSEFSVTESDSEGNELRSTDQIKQESPELFTKLQDLAITRSEESYSNSGI